MRAVQFARTGGPEVLEVRTVPAPVAGAGDVIVRVHAASINPSDTQSRRIRFAGFPRGTGLDFAGEVVEVGRSAGGLYVGQRVWGYLGGTAGLRATGSAADYLVTSAEHVATAPNSLDFLSAAALPLVGLTALQSLRDVLCLQANHRLLVIGASGGVGSIAVQLGRAMGASVTAVTSARNADFCRQLGADHVQDYAAVALELKERTYDALLACHGASLRRYLPLLHPRGRAATLPSDTFAFAIRSWLRAGPRVRIVYTWARRSDLDLLAWYVDRGELRPVIEMAYPLAGIQEAHRAVESGHTRGKHVIDLTQ